MFSCYLEKKKNQIHKIEFGRIRTWNNLSENDGMWS